MNLQSLFPVTLSTQWHDADKFSLDENLKRWLLDPKSLTARLKSNCEQFRIELLGQRIESCQESEAVPLIPRDVDVLVREVLLYCDNKPQVFARSLLPVASLTGKEQALANLGTQSLGQVIFNNPSLERQTIEIAEFDDSSEVVKMVKKLACTEQSTTLAEHLWGRRSIFVLEGKPLMVAEVFLPGSFAYQTAQKSGVKYA